MIDCDKKNLNDVNLLTAYHYQCVGCHDKMGIQKGSSMADREGDRCAACHKKKPGGPAETTAIKNGTVVKQNTVRSLNTWRPK
jgi:hypothetical protein